MTLGHEDYGLMGLIGGLIGFVSFLNNLLAGAVARFYAFAVGQSQIEGKAEVGIDECRRWFSSALFLHTIVSVVLVSIGYPVGVWAIENFLTIPRESVEACIWVWRFTCLASFVGMINVPFSAMYNAKQEIAELTIYSFVTATVQFVILCYAVGHPSKYWLVRLSAWSCLSTIVPQMIICFRAIRCYRECRLRRIYLFDFDRLKRILLFSGSRLVVSLPIMLAHDGGRVLVNKFFGPVKNAAMSVSGTVSNHCLTLSSALSGAFSPAITTAAGVGEFEKMRKLAFRTCSLSCVSILVFALPLTLEIDEVMLLWLKDPPADSGMLCVCVLVCALCAKLSEGHWIAVYAIGQIGKMCLTEACAWLIVLPVAYFLFHCGLGVIGIGLSLILANILAVLVKLYYGERVAGLSIIYWFKRIFIPILVVSVISLMVGYLPSIWMTPSFVRIVVTTVFVDVVFIPLAFLGVLDHSERNYLKKRLVGFWEKLTK